MVLLLAVIVVYIVARIYYRYRYWQEWVATHLHPRPAHSRTGTLYVFRGKHEWLGAVKIGRAKEPKQRLRAHQTANPHGIHVLAVIRVKNDKQAEYNVHSLFADRRIEGGEWFNLTFDMWLFIQALRNVKLTNQVRSTLH